MDLSQAFDCVDRVLLLRVLREEDIANEDELRMIQLLLRNIKLRARIGNQFGEEFGTHRGILQGDGLSPKLFTVYLEAALRELRKVLIDSGEVVLDIAYADDVDFIAMSKRVLTRIEEIAPALLQKWRLKVNTNKTERYTLKRGVLCNVKKLGSMVDSNIEVEYRGAQGKAAFGSRRWRLWYRDKRVSLQVRLRLHNALVKSVMIYNIGTLAAPATVIKHLEVLHRKQLRVVLRIHYPNKISNYNLYKRCGTESLSTTILRQRWRLLGHILRLPATAPARVAMGVYYNMQQQTSEFKRYRGATKTTLPRLLEQDLAYAGKQLRSLEDLKALKVEARDRVAWGKLIERIVSADRSNKRTRRSKRPQHEEKQQHHSQDSAYADPDQHFSKDVWVNSGKRMRVNNRKRHAPDGGQVVLKNTNLTASTRTVNSCQPDEESPTKKPRRAI